MPSKIEQFILRLTAGITKMPAGEVEAIRALSDTSIIDVMSRMVRIESSAETIEAFVAERSDMWALLDGDSGQARHYKLPKQRRHIGERVGRRAVSDPPKPGES